MPTLIDVPTTHHPEEGEDDDNSETTMLYDQSMTLLLEDSFVLGVTPGADRCASLQSGKSQENQEEPFRNDLILSSRSKPVETRQPLQTTLTAGPNESIYRSKHEPLVKTTIQKFDHSHPGTLRDYRTLSHEEKVCEQQRVLALLSRLHIGRGNRHQLREEVNNLEKDLSQRLGEFYDTTIPFLSSGADSPTESTTTIEGGHSVCTSPVEIARAADDLSSTSTNPYKRSAASSAKRGADLSRIRYNDDFGMPSSSIHCLDEHDRHDVDGEWYDQHASNVERLSISPKALRIGLNLQEDLFPASQSPISPKFTYHAYSDDGSEEEDAEDDSDSVKRSRNSKQMLRAGPSRGSVPTTNDTIGTWSAHKVSKRQLTRDMPVHVGLKDGATFHLEKLHVQRSEVARLENGIGRTTRRLVHFPDPFLKYNSKLKTVLDGVFESLVRSEQEIRTQTFVETTSVNVLLSLTVEQITDLCMKLFLQDEAQQQERNQCYLARSSILQGETLIVARTKEDLVHWERALREGTGCSVYNIAAAPLSERVRLATAEKVTNYDIILTTFDALKSADATIPVDDTGYAILGESQDAGGWMASRVGASQGDSRPQTCMQLSVLHKVNFRRTIFLDVLGRKSFMAKFGTARARAATALRGNSRIAFFCQTEADGDSAFRALKKSDNRAQESLSAILHLVSQVDDDGSSDIDDDSNVVAVSKTRLEACTLDIKNLL